MRLYRNKKRYEIIQTVGWKRQDGSPLFPEAHNVVIKQFKTYFWAAAWKLFNYDFFAETSWQVTFVWTIHKIKMT